MGGSPACAGVQETRTGHEEIIPSDLQAIAKKLLAEPDGALKLAHYARTLYDRVDAQRDPLIALGVEAWMRAPDDPAVRHAAEWAMERRVPRWHYGILRDDVRNFAYAQALRAHVKPDMVVLEIGAGSGLLAMLAARAGAKHVYACEMEPLLAQAAAENVRRNGLQDRVTILPKHSGDIVVGQDMPRAADLLVSEIVDNALLGEDILASVEDARTRLLAEGGVMLPDAGSLKGALIEMPDVAPFPVKEAEGIDVSAIDRFTPAKVGYNGTTETEDEALTRTEELLRFDLAKGVIPPSVSEVTLHGRRDGLAFGCLTWIRLEFAGAAALEVRPGEPSSWAPVLHAFPKPLRVRKGAPVRVVVEHDRAGLDVRPA